LLVFGTGRLVLGNAFVTWLVLHSVQKKTPKKNHRQESIRQQNDKGEVTKNRSLTNLDVQLLATRNKIDTFARYW
jgi:hypothetical protein